MMLRWFDAIQTDQHLALTETGYINDVLVLQWIWLFNKGTFGRTRVAIISFYVTDLDRIFHDNLWNFVMMIISLYFFLYANTSHILHTLGVGIIIAYKHWYSEAVEAATMTGCQKFTEDEILRAIAESRKRKMACPHNRAWVSIN